MAFFIGIDGGGTKTVSVLTDENLNLISKAIESKTNPLLLGVEESTKVLLRLIKTVLAKKKDILIETVVIGLAGCGRKETAEAVRKKLFSQVKKEKISIKEIFVLPDAEIALEGAFPDDNGAILIAGTGSIIYGKSKSGKIYRAGGFGKIIGDEGSGYAIGLRGLKAVAENIDGRGANTSLTRILKNQFGMVDRDSIITKVYSENFDIASLAEKVVKTAGKGDSVCCNIIEYESDQLIDLVNALKKKMSVRKLKISLLGGLLLNKNVYSQLVSKKITDGCNGVEIVKPKFPPEFGAVLIGKKKNNF
jgi:N-acetylglucosamine kinase-like BadF-type ATPase